MPSPTKTQLNLSVDASLKEEFRELCQRERLSLAAAFESFMQACIEKGEILGTALESPSTIEIDEKIESAVSKAVATAIAAKLEPLQEELGYLKQKVAELAPVIDDGQDNERLRPEVEPSSSKPSETETDIDNSGLTTSQLARELGVAHSQISRWRSGERTPRDPAIAEKFSQWEFNEESKRWYRREDTTAN